MLWDIKHCIVYNIVSNHDYFVFIIKKFHMSEELFDEF